MAQLVKHTYADKPSRFYKDGIRVTESAYESAKFWHDLSCIHTVARKTPGHYVHYVSTRARLVLGA